MTSEGHKRLRQHADAADRAMKGWALRVTRASWSQVAEVCGFTDEANAPTDQVPVTPGSRRNLSPDQHF
jgi:hypothetical protein